MTTHDNLWNHDALLRLLQLTSPTLPIGTYSYSQGLEWAVAAGWVRDEQDVERWVTGVARHVIARLDVPLLGRFYAAWEVSDEEALVRWSRFLRASREAAEFQAEDRQLGGALARLLMDLEVHDAAMWTTDSYTSLPNMFALAAVRWDLPVTLAAIGYLWMWCDHQVSAAVKLVPLGQTAGQQILPHLRAGIPEAVGTGLALSDEEVGAVAPGLAIAGALHETQYTRLFRS